MVDRRLCTKRSHLHAETRSRGVGVPVFCPTHNLGQISRDARGLHRLSAPPRLRVNQRFVLGAV